MGTPGPTQEWTDVLQHRDSTAAQAFGTSPTRRFGFTDHMVISTTATTTPLKGRLYDAMGGTDNHHTSNHHHHQVNDEVDQQTEEAEKQVSSWDVWWSMILTVLGKDKMARMGQYLLRLIMYYANKTEGYLSDDMINLNLILARYNDREKQLNLFRNLIKHPQNFARIATILVCHLFQQRVKAVVPALSLFRQMLRTGKSPFRIRNLIVAVKRAISPDGTSVNWDKLLVKKNMSDLTGLYYNICDEYLLLYKLKLVHNRDLHALAGRHEMIAWFVETCDALNTTWKRLQELSDEEMDLKIQTQVKQRARVLSRLILGANSIPTASNNNNNASNSNGNVGTHADGLVPGSGVNSMSSSMMSSYLATHDESREELKQMKEIQFKKYSAYLDLYKLLSDFAFCFYLVFKVPLPFGSLQIILGVMASALSLHKIYRELRKKLVERKKTELAKH